MRKLLVICLMLLSTSSGLWAQGNVFPDSVRLSGIIMDKDSLFTLPYAAYNFRKLNYTADESGQFSIWAKKGDLIKFSHVGFKDTYIQVHDTLDVDNYLVGIFLTRDTFRLSEVIVVPRYQHLAAQAKYMPLKVTPELVYGTNNVKQSTRQALTQAPQKLDAEQNQMWVIREQTRKTVYKTQVMPDQMVGLSTEDLIPFMIYLSPDKQRKVRKSANVNVMSQQELNFLMNLYRRQQQEIEEKEN
jgi:hypothetical protein